MKTVTLDGVEIELEANVASPKDLDDVFKNDGEGVGLYRTEFLYFDSSLLPPEDTQFEQYRDVVEAMKGRPVVIRTLDIGGDKKVDYLSIPEEQNPFLGYRAIRLCLDRQEIFKVQLRAILRASAFGQVRILCPMISSLAELRSAKSMLEETKEAPLQGVPFDEHPVGHHVECRRQPSLRPFARKPTSQHRDQSPHQYAVAVDGGTKNSPPYPCITQRPRLIKQFSNNKMAAGIRSGCARIAETEAQTFSSAWDSRTSA
jgi:phosphotransferase system enzyme I (PtsI)